MALINSNGLFEQRWRGQNYSLKHPDNYIKTATVPPKDNKPDLFVERDVIQSTLSSSVDRVLHQFSTALL